MFIDLINKIRKERDRPTNMKKNSKRSKLKETIIFIDKGKSQLHSIFRAFFLFLILYFRINEHKYFYVKMREKVGIFLFLFGVGPIKLTVILLNLNVGL